MDSVFIMKICKALQNLMSITANGNFTKLTIVLKQFINGTTRYIL